MGWDGLLVLIERWNVNSRSSTSLQVHCSTFSRLTGTAAWTVLNVWTSRQMSAGASAAAHLRRAGSATAITSNAALSRRLKLCFQGCEVLLRVSHLAEWLVAANQPESGHVDTCRDRGIALFHSQERRHRHLQTLGPFAKRLTSPLSSRGQVVPQLAQGGTSSLWKGFKGGRQI